MRGWEKGGDGGWKSRGRREKERERVGHCTGSERERTRDMLEVRLPACLPHSSNSSNSSHYSRCCNSWLVGQTHTASVKPRFYTFQHEAQQPYSAPRIFDPTLGKYFYLLVILKHVSPPRTFRKILKRNYKWKTKCQYKLLHACYIEVVAAWQMTVA